MPVKAKDDVASTASAPVAPPAQLVPAVVPSAVPIAPDPSVQKAFKAVVDNDLQQEYQKSFQANQKYLKEGASNFNTILAPEQESAFRTWVKENKVPFNPDTVGPTDYDMRGFWSALQRGDARATTGINPNDKKLHFSDYWKTPYHKSFSNESQWANPAKAPKWNEKDQLVLPDGTVVFDERAEAKKPKKLQNGR